MSSQKKILIVHNKYQFAGGEDTVVAQDSALLSKYDHKVFLYERHNDELKSRGRLGRLLLPFETLYSVRTVREVRKMIRDNHIDIVHVHNTLPLISLSVYYAAKKEGCRLVQTLHNFRFVCPGAILFRDNHLCEDCLTKGLSCSVQHSCYRSSKVQTALVAFMTWFHRKIKTFQLPDAYIALTEFQKSRFIPFLPKEKIFVKPNYLEKPILKDDTDVLAQITQLGDYYLYVGRIEKVKGIFVMLEAFKNMPDRKLVILGSGPEDEAVRTFIKEYSCSNISFLGFTPHEKALLYLSHAKAMLLPTLWYEGFPMSIVESMALGIPVIASDSANIASILEHKKHGYLFQTGNSVDLCDGIRWIAADADRMREIQNNCLDTFENLYTPEVSYQKLMNIYKNELV